MKQKKTIALVAHDNRKKDLIEWFDYNYNTLLKHNLICTGTTGKMVEESLRKKLSDSEMQKIKITKLKSGPLGGDQQLGAYIVDGQIDMLIFLWDPMQPQPHDVDVKALLRISSLYNIPTACNRSTADFIISSPLLNEAYEPIIRDYSGYINRVI
jgi:methylglyoxal synthase